MSRLQQIDPAEADGKAKELLDAVKRKMGTVPNVTRAMASSPATLELILTSAARWRKASSIRNCANV